MNEFTPEDRVELIHTTGEDTGLGQGDRGTVTRVDWYCAVHIAWDNGATLSGHPGAGDRIHLTSTAPAPHYTTAVSGEDTPDCGSAHPTGAGALNLNTTEGAAILDLHTRFRALSGDDHGTDLDALLRCWFRDHGINPTRSVRVVAGHRRDNTSLFTVFALLDTDSREVTVIAVVSGQVTDLAGHHLGGPAQPAHITVEATTADEAADLATEALAGRAPR